MSALPPKADIRDRLSYLRPIGPGSSAKLPAIRCTERDKSCRRVRHFDRVGAVGRGDAVYAKQVITSVRPCPDQPLYFPSERETILASILKKPPRFAATTARPARHSFAQSRDDFTITGPHRKGRRGSSARAWPLIAALPSAAAKNYLLATSQMSNKR